MERWLGLALLGLTGLLGGETARAQTDEIQVYDASIAPPGVLNLTLHDNYTPNGRTSPAFPGGIVPNHALNGVPEWAYGVTRWFEAGLYLPLYSRAGNGSVTLNGLKLRALFVEPDADEKNLIYGINFEFSYNAGHWDPTRSTQEIRPIVGWRFGRFDLIVNPILDNSYKRLSALDFAPATRFAYHVGKAWTLAAEEYDDFGHLGRFYPQARQQHQLFAVLDHAGSSLNVEAGVGAGLTSATDRLVLKLILSRDLH